MKEKELVNLINNYLEKNKVLYGNEIRMGIGIPDIMFISNVVTEEQIIIDYYALKLYDLMSKKNIDNVDDLVKISKIPKRNIVKHLKLLEEKNIININCGIIELKKKIDIKKVGTNVSIEVKIKDWRSGFNQAQRYLDFSDYTYLAIHEKYLRNINEEEFITSGVGLLTVSQNSIKEIIPPIKSRICNPYFKYVSISSLKNKYNINVSEKKKRLRLYSLWDKGD